jgi:heme-degrading monooxygenase HmoA
MPVTFINLFQVPPSRDEAFGVLWREVHDYMAGREGYQGHRLHRALREDAAYRYANIASWESAAAWQAAHDGTFRSLVARPGWREFPSVPALYEVVRSDQATMTVRENQ